MENMASSRVSRRRAIKSTAAVGTTLSLTGCLSSLTGQQSLTLRFNCPAGEDSIQGKIANWMSEGVAERTDDRIQIDVFLNGELGGLTESIENLTTGTIDMYPAIASLAGSQWGPIQILDAPYLYNSTDHMLEVTDPTQSDIMAEMTESLVEESNIRILGSILHGIRRVTISGDPVRHPDDFNGRKVRAVPIDMMFEGVNGIGAEAVNVGFSELPTALSTGSVAGQENPYNVTVDGSLHEHADYLIETNHITSPLPIYIADQTYQELSEDDQQVFHDVLGENKQRAVDDVLNGVEPLREEVQNAGVEVIRAEDIEMDAFKSRARNHIRESFPQDWIDRIEQIHGGTYE